MGVGEAALDGLGLGSGARKGISSASNGIPNQAQGKRIKTPAQITLSNPGRFFGREVYRCYRLKVRAPATDLHGCVQGLKGFWFFATPPPARSQRSQMEVYARPPA